MSDWIPTESRDVRIPIDGVALDGTLALPHGAEGLVLFAHGSGSSRFSPRNRAVADVLHRAGMGTVLMDLLTEDEELVDRATARHRFDIELLAARLAAVTDWICAQAALRLLHVGYFGASTGAAAALRAAAARPEVVRAVVSRGGRPDLAGEALTHVRAPTLLIVGGLDFPVIPLNRSALGLLRCPKEMVIVPGATHLFEEPGTLDEVARLARDWFRHHLLDAARHAEAPN